MQTKHKIGLLMMLISFIMSCEKPFDESQKESAQTQEPTVSILSAAQPCYYKDSLRCATIVRVKSVICKQEGYELLSTSIVKNFQNPFPNIEPPYISNVRNKKDSLIVKLVWEIDCKAEGLAGIELVDGTKINFLYKKYRTTVKDSSCYYTAEFVILKRKWTRLQFAFEGQNLNVLNDASSFSL